jgi:hypothetical protein
MVAIVAGAENVVEKNLCRLALLQPSEEKEPRTENRIA